MYKYDDLHIGYRIIFPVENASPEVRPNARYSDEKCCICLNDIQHEVQACCGHAFCAECFISYWQAQNYNCIECPLCKRQITLLFE